MAINNLKPMTAYAAETATQSEADETDMNVTDTNEASKAPFMNIASVQSVSDESDRSGSAGGAFESVFLKSFTELQTDDFGVELGPDDNWSHCNDRDGEGNAWRVYDHRTEGEIHFNKRDLDLKAKESDIAIVKSPVGMPGRAIMNKFMTRVMNGEQISHSPCHGCLVKCSPKEIPYCITDGLINAVKGNVDEGLLFCGAKAWKAERLQTVQEVINDLF